MRLADKARGMQKEAILGAAAAAAAQNAIGIPIARSKKFKQSLARAALTGAAGKKAPRTLKSVATDAAAGVAAPEVNMVKNEAYRAGEKLRGKLKLDKLNKRDLAVARLAAAGDEAGLKRIGKSNSQLANTVREAKKKGNIPDIPKATTRGEMKNIQKLPAGSRAPSSTKAALAANLAITPLPGGAGAAAVNAAKIGAGTKAFSESKVGKALSKKFAVDPVKASAKAGAKGEKFNAKAHWVNSVALNPFTEEAKRQAYKGGKAARK